MKPGSSTQRRRNSLGLRRSDFDISISVCSADSIVLFRAGPFKPANAGLEEEFSYIIVKRLRLRLVFMSDNVLRFDVFLTKIQQCLIIRVNGIYVLRVPLCLWLYWSKSNSSGQTLISHFVGHARSNAGGCAPEVKILGEPQ
jgi:hypothetical protein